MALKKDDKANFATLQRAFRDGNVALMECKDKATGEYRAVICMINPNPEDAGGADFVPVCHLPTGNPYEEYTPPMED